MVLPSLDWMVDDATRLAECRHDHPFAVLGPHRLPEGAGRAAAGGSAPPANG
jgi:1,4-alpha-glucan branching enzyme